MEDEYTAVCKDVQKEEKPIEVTLFTALVDEFLILQKDVEEIKSILAHIV